MRDVVRRMQPQEVGCLNYLPDQVLAQARCLAEEDQSPAAGDRLAMPEYGMATLLAARGTGR